MTTPTPPTGPLPSLEGWEPTRDTLHRYSKFLGAVRQTLVPAHPHWWHAGLKVHPAGITTGLVALPGSSSDADPEPEGLKLTLDLVEHKMEVSRRGDESRELPLGAGLTASELAAQSLEYLREMGIHLEVDAARYADDSPRAYDPAHAQAYLAALNRFHRAFDGAAQHLRAAHEADLSPIHIWPHHFDLSFECFGEREDTYEEDGEMKVGKAQIGFGFASGDAEHPEPYLYAQPWPFEEELTLAPLPRPATWITAPWKGAQMSYGALRERGDDGAIQAFIEAVYEAAEPILS